MTTTGKIRFVLNFHLCTSFFFVDVRRDTVLGELDNLPQEFRDTDPPEGVVGTVSNLIFLGYFFYKGALPLKTAAQNRRWRSYVMYLFLVSVHVSLLRCCSWNRHQQIAPLNQVLRKKTDQERKNSGTNLTAIQRNSEATVAVMMLFFFPSGSLPHNITTPYSRERA